MRNVIITGGARSIGRCIAEQFALEGERVFVIDKESPAARPRKDDMVKYINQ